MKAKNRKGKSARKYSPRIEKSWKGNQQVKQMVAELIGCDLQLGSEIQFVGQLYRQLESGKELVLSPKQVIWLQTVYRKYRIEVAGR